MLWSGVVDSKGQEIYHMKSSGVPPFVNEHYPGDCMKYFIEVHTKQGVEHVSMLLADLAITENWMSDQEDTFGGTHQVCEIPDLKMMKLIYSMHKADKRVRIDYWKREETGGARLELADFLVHRPKPVIRRQAEFRRSMARLDEIIDAKASKGTK